MKTKPRPLALKDAPAALVEEMRAKYRALAKSTDAADRAVAYTELGALDREMERRATLNVKA